jgi:hypothetical protein
LFVWILAGVTAYLALGIVVGRFCAVNRIAEVRDGLFEEGLPGAVTGRGRQSTVPTGGLTWTEAHNLTVADASRRPGQATKPTQRETAREEHSGRV